MRNDSVRMDLEARARAGYEAFQRGDTEFLLDIAAPDIVIKQPDEIPDAKTYVGHDGVRQAFADWPSLWESFAIVDWKVVEVDDPHAILVESKQRLQARGGIEFELDVFNVFLYDNEGKVRIWEMYLGLDEASARLHSLLPR